jgi:hypothetical protein
MVIVRGLMRALLGVAMVGGMVLTLCASHMGLRAAELNLACNCNGDTDCPSGFKSCNTTRNLCQSSSCSFSPGVTCYGYCVPKP